MAFQATVGETQIQWRDTKRYLWIVGAIIPLIPFAAWGLVELTGQGIFWYFGPFFVFGIIPIVDILAGLDRNNPPDEVLDALENDRYYRWITYLFIPAQLASLVWGGYLFGGGTFGDMAPLDVVDKIGLALGIGMVAGIGINTAHELGHKKEQHER